MNNKTHCTWGGKQFPITSATPYKYHYQVTVKDILDNYTALPVNNLKGFASRIACPVRKACAISVLNETELTEYPLDFTVEMEEPTPEAKANMPKLAKKAYQPQDATDASIMATLLQGKDDRYKATLEEARRRGFTFTSKQLAVALRKNRNLQED